MIIALLTNASMRPWSDRARAILEASGEDWVTERYAPPDPLHYPWPVDFFVSYGLRYRCPKIMCDAYEHEAVNLHVGYLPWNRGADPNLWSWIEGTPKGVSLHWLTYEIDGGPLIDQRAVELDPAEHTLRTSWERLQEVALELLEECWPAIRAGEAPTVEQSAGGSYHRVRDRARIELPCLPLPDTLGHPKPRPVVPAGPLDRGWDTRVTDLRLRGERSKEGNDV